MLHCRSRCYTAAYTAGATLQVLHCRCYTTLQVAYTAVRHCKLVLSSTPNPLNNSYSFTLGCALVQPYIENPEFMPDKIKSVSTAAHGLCSWVRAMEAYNRVIKVRLGVGLRVWVRLRGRCKMCEQVCNCDICELHACLSCFVFALGSLLNCVHKSCNSFLVVWSCLRVI